MTHYPLAQNTHNYFRKLQYYYPECLAPFSISEIFLYYCNVIMLSETIVVRHDTFRVTIHFDLLKPYNILRSQQAIQNRPFKTPFYNKIKILDLRRKFFSELYSPPLEKGCFFFDFRQSNLGMLQVIMYSF